MMLLSKILGRGVAKLIGVGRQCLAHVQQRTHSVFPCRFDDTEVPGLPPRARFRYIGI